MPIGTKSSASVQPIIIGCKAPKFFGATSVSAGGLMWNGRSASEWGGG
jgi:hypothetical protein